MARNRGDHKTKRIKIADAACDVIISVGIESMRLKDVARQLGCTTGVIQYYFADKQALLLFAKNRLFDLAFSTIKEKAAGYEGLERIEAMARELLPLTAKRLRMFQLLAAFRGQAIGNHDLMALQRSRDEVGWALFCDVIKALQEQGAIAASIDPETEAIGLVAFVEGLATQLIMGSRRIGKVRLQHLLDQYIACVFGPRS